MIYIMVVTLYVCERTVPILLHYHSWLGVMEKLLDWAGSVNYSSMNYSASEQFNEI